MTDLNTTLVHISEEQADKERRQIEGQHIRFVAAARRHAELVAVYYTTLTHQGVPEALANTLTLQYQAAFLGDDLEEDDD